MTPTGQVLRESVAGVDVLEAAAQASAFDRTHAQTRAMREGRTDGARVAAGIGLALAWHGAGFTGSGEVKLASVASIELTGDKVRIIDRFYLGEPTFRDLSQVEFVGAFGNYEDAKKAWKARAQATVDNAHMRYFILHAHKLIDPRGDAA